MQRINRSAHAPVGTAVFLFLGLAILPVSLRVAGVQVSFSPRLSAASDAWQQIADVFGASYVAAPAAELCVVKDLDVDPATPAETCTRPRSDFACAGDFEKSAVQRADANSTRERKPAFAFRAASKSESIGVPGANRVALSVAAEAIKTSFENQISRNDAMRAMKIDIATQNELVKDLRKQVFMRGFEPPTADQIRNLTLPKGMRVLVHTKRATAGLLPRTAECKVYSALAQARRQECERAGLISNLPTGTDNSEF
jgi:hypothetical protein